MVPFGGFTDAVLPSVTRYGYVALFVSTAWLRDDPAFAAGLGASSRFALLVTGISVPIGTLTPHGTGTRLPVDRLATAGGNLS